MIYIVFNQSLKGIHNTLGMLFEGDGKTSCESILFKILLLLLSQTKRRLQSCKSKVVIHEPECQRAILHPQSPAFDQPRRWRLRSSFVRWLLCLFRHRTRRSCLNFLRFQMGSRRSLSRGRLSAFSNFRRTRRMYMLSIIRR